MKHEKIIDRIRKLLAMSRDTSSPYEAGIAAKRARKLIDEHQVSELDLSTVSSSNMGSNNYETRMTSTIAPIGTLAVAVAVAVAIFNEGIVRYVWRDKHYDVQFSGMLVDTICAVELMKYLRNEMYRQAERFTQGRAYRLGFANGVTNQVDEAMRKREQIKTSSGAALVACKGQLVEREFGPTEYSDPGPAKFTGSDSFFSKGYQSGQSASLARQVSGVTQRKISNQ